MISSFYLHWDMKYQFGPFWPIFGLMTLPRGVKTLKFWNSGFKNKYSTANSPLLLSSSFYHHCYRKYKFGLFLTKFWLNDVTTGVKTVIFWESDLRNKFLYSKFNQILISIFLSPSIHDIQLWSLFTQFGNNDATREKNIPKFCKINQRIGFDLLKMQMAEV